MRVFSGVLVALALTISGTAPPAPATVPSSSQADTLKVHREYGQGPVTIPAGVDRVEMTFHGRKGDPVRIDEPCDKVSLRGSSGKVARWIGGAWRLPSAGRYAFVLTGCEAKKKSSAQLTKIRLRPLVVNGDAKVLTYRGRGAYEDWAKVVVPHHGRVQVRPTSPGQVSPWGALYLGDAPVLNIWTWHQEYELSPKAVYLEAGAPVANELGEMSPTAEPLVPQAGQLVILLPAENRVRARATKTRSVPGTLDGAAVEVAAERPYQEVGVRFASQGDHWVTAAVNGRLESRSMPSLALTGPDGSTLVGLNHATYGSGGSPGALVPAGGRQLPGDRTDGSRSPVRNAQPCQRPGARRGDAH